MSEVIVVQSQPAQPSQRQKSTTEVLLGYFISFALIALLIAALIAAYLVIDNWEWIVTLFTTGFIGFLNPFDDPDGDLTVSKALTNAGVPGPWRLFTAPLRIFSKLTD
tara:strand:- start:5941 stop:6264 length:324 start_codon:yes stop_codon:yes gene_type:complete